MWKPQDFPQHVLEFRVILTVDATVEYIKLSQMLAMGNCVLVALILWHMANTEIVNAIPLGAVGKPE